jgi:hypothetical protein
MSDIQAVFVLYVGVFILCIGGRWLLDEFRWWHGAEG